MRQICETLGFNKSTFYYQPKIDTSDANVSLICLLNVRRKAVSSGDSGSSLNEISVESQRAS